jgi:hypothetical protein
MECWHKIGNRVMRIRETAPSQNIHGFNYRMSFWKDDTWFKTCPFRDVIIYMGLHLHLHFTGLEKAIVKEKLDGLAVALRRAIAEVKQRWSDIGWPKIIILSSSLRHVKPLVPDAFAVVRTHQPALGPRGKAHSPFE